MGQVVRINNNTNKSRKSKATVHPNIDLNITWLLTQISDEQSQFSPCFTISRSKKTCRTPRRNPEIEAALTYFRTAHKWAVNIKQFLMESVFSVQEKHGLDLRKLDKTTSLFVPVLPLFEDTIEPVEIASSQSLLVKPLPVLFQAPPPSLVVADLILFLEEEVRTLKEKFGEFEQMYPDNRLLITHIECKTVLVMNHWQKVLQSFSDGINSVEKMLKRQLCDAIGKEIESEDFLEYMKYHNRKVFQLDYQPIPFCYAIRIPNHYPEGIVGIEDADSSSTPQYIQTIVRWSAAVRPMHFSLDVATKVSFYGDRFLHAYVCHQFKGERSSITKFGSSYTSI
eukprot:TRINITY_DN1903_c0_g4_i1.p1 TRINITY_DN1903_c0_g4~~TRINITY_DN1903_c0_g4_i1.p1  ORF type:complete len:339 (+),score=49.37 TRINITY_DN1903_c0_g4_i1:568-1584(+)